ncbi:hypothetical protein Esi_0220_0014 [Ectocarpus siliculosus]|uniref:Uncharacterized protein n=1 Tax=Ectocarpus siliculosus TaxID=2880 RepID=D8LIM2_ECTSI|nr:hypothetical protein Esi_0220_0014 [Ectocarpus siliculosus]|eukprot:CBN75932.1 hypothetical protein Esi_0220_0014 [Ectocarpus siliculosus]
MSGWGTPKSAAGDIGGRSPRAVDGREQDRASRRLGLTHSLTSPRAPEPAKPELPARPNSDDLPRPRSLSPPRRNLAPPSVTGSALSARLERASLVRTASSSNGPPIPPPPKTRARFSAKRGELDDVAADGGGGAADGDDVAAAAAAAAPSPAPSRGAEAPLAPPTPATAGSSSSSGGGGRVAALAKAIESQRKAEQAQRPPEDGDETPVMTLPDVITEGLAAGDRRMMDSRSSLPHTVGEEEEEQSPVAVGMGAKRVGRVRGRGGAAAASQRGGPRSTAGGIGASSPVYGTGNSQIQASPQYWVPRKLSRSPMKKNIESAPSYSPATSTRPLW